MVLKEISRAAQSPCTDVRVNGTYYPLIASASDLLKALRETVGQEVV